MLQLLWPAIYLAPPSLVEARVVSFTVFAPWCTGTALSPSSSIVSTSTGVVRMLPHA
jgi:hypothetical protein